MFDNMSKRYQQLANWQKAGLIGLAICLFSLALLLPQLKTGSVIAGSDFLFHYNRFYETAEQLKTGNFSYFISLYGFSGSARIVNALYGPYFAYVQGFILLLSKTWYGYQLVSRFLVASLAGFSMYALLRRVAIRRRTSLLVALLFMTTFSIQYWSYRQGFSSWGAALMPWCLIPAIDFLKTGQVKVLRLAIAVALMTQVHMLSAFMLILMYLPFYLYGFIKSQEKVQVILKGLLAVVLCLLLSANIWAAMIQVAGHNTLVQPFINAKLYIMTVNQRSIEWLITPLPLLFILLYALSFSFRHWRHYDGLLRVTTATFFMFLVLSSSIFPWYEVNKLQLGLVNLIQFPFRLFIPTTILLLLLMALIIERYFERKHARFLLCLLLLATSFAYGQTYKQSMAKINISRPVKNGKHQFVLGTNAQVRESFHSQDLSDLLNVVVKSTPDYLPMQKGNTENKYNLYEKHVLANRTAFQEEQVGDSLRVTWTADKAGKVDLPIVKYRDTRLVLNGKELTSSDYSQTGIGTVSVMQKAGENTLEVTYRVSWLPYLLVANGFMWLLCLFYCLYQKLKKA
ncbi:hypothetical protein [Streptococcus sp. zg-JUN1979]|uniref:hypothetical protein n=1 Tax=Streptococcus sp. zg-JUN1979 TaxID=3391450 RepID=UPI0039A6593F